MARIVPEVWNIPARLREKVGPRAGRQRLMTHDGHVLLLLHQVPRDADPDRHAVVFWRDIEGEWRCAPGRDDIATLQRCDRVECVGMCGVHTNGAHVPFMIS